MANSILQTVAAAFVHSTVARTVTFGSNCTPGSLIAIWVGGELTAGSGLTYTVSDPTNGTYTRFGGVNTDSGGIRSGAWFYFKNQTGNTQLVISSTPSADAYQVLEAYEISVTTPSGVIENSLVRVTTNLGSIATINAGTCTAASGNVVLAGCVQGNASGETCTVSGGGFAKDMFKTNGSTEGGTTASDMNASGNEACTFSTTTNYVSPLAMTISFNTGGGGAAANGNFLAFM